MNIRIPNPSKSIDMLNELMDTLKDVIVHNAAAKNAREMSGFNMRDYVTIGPVDDESKHLCGTAACILGYQAFANTPTDFLEYDLRRASGHIENKLNLVLGIQLACSIYDSFARDRMHYAEDLEFNFVDFVHLRSDETTLEDAIEYMEFVIRLCEAQL
jgi:hypothetical protein